MSTKKKAKNTLTLNKKYDISGTNPQLSSRALAARFGCGKSQVTKILSKKESLVEVYVTLSGKRNVFEKKLEISVWVSLESSLRRRYDAANPGFVAVSCHVL